MRFLMASSTARLQLLRLQHRGGSGMAFRHLHKSVNGTDPPPPPTKDKIQCYETTWRNRWLTAEAKSIDDMIRMLRDAANELESMKNDGIEFNGYSARDDYIMLTTEDPELAEKYDMLPMHKFDSDE